MYRNIRLCISCVILVTILTAFYVTQLNSNVETHLKDTIFNPDAELPGKFSYFFPIPADRICKQNDSFTFMILVCSAVQNVQERQAIRETWGSQIYKEYNKGSVRMAFILGSSSDQDGNKAVVEESKKHGDIIQANFLDTYDNLTYKSLALLKWVRDMCSTASFVLKTDDDMYINVPNLVLSTKPFLNRKKTMFGYLFKKAPPVRDPSDKWYVPYAQYSWRYFPDYLSGTAYAMTSDCAAEVFSASLEVPFLLMEDVYVTGLCAARANIARHHATGFQYSRVSPTGCAFKNAVSGHHVTVSDMGRIWSELNNLPLRCAR